MDRASVDFLRSVLFRELVRMGPPQAMRTNLGRARSESTTPRLNYNVLSQERFAHPYYGSSQ